MTLWHETRHPDRETLAAALAEALAAAARTALDHGGEAVLALAGGTTPLPAYRRLAALALPWERIRLLPTDDRWVAATHPASNAGALKTAFSGCAATIETLVPPAPKALPDTVHARRGRAGRRAPFSAVLLGMGTDGHIASLFPGVPAAALDPDDPAPAIALIPEPLPPQAPYPRISLTISRLLNTHRLLLAVTGADKLAVLQRAMACAAGTEALPVSALLHAAAPVVEIHWSP